MYGPLHNKQAVEIYKSAVDEAVKNGGKIEVGGNVSWKVLRKSPEEFIFNTFFNYQNFANIFICKLKFIYFDCLTLSTHMFILSKIINLLGDR